MPCLFGPEPLCLRSLFDSADVAALSLILRMSPRCFRAKAPPFRRPSDAACRAFQAYLRSRGVYKY